MIMITCGHVATKLITLKLLLELIACLELLQKITHIPIDDIHPELDDSPLLGLNDYRKFQMLLGMLQWMVTVGKPGLSATVASLNCFVTCTREHHLQLAAQVFGYVKTVLHTKITIDSRPIDFKHDTLAFQVLRPDFLQDYPDTSEKISTNFPSVFETILQSHFLVDSDHDPDQVTCRSLAGLIDFIGSTPTT